VPSGSGSPTPSSSGSTVPSPLGTERIDPALADAIRTRGAVKAVVTIQAAQGSPDGREMGVLPGPFAPSKRRALADTGDGIQLVTDYPELPLLLVTISSVDALSRLSSSTATANIAPDSRNTASG